MMHCFRVHKLVSFLIYKLCYNGWNNIWNTCIFVSVWFCVRSLCCTHPQRTGIFVLNKCFKSDYIQLNSVNTYPRQKSLFGFGHFFLSIYLSLVTGSIKFWSLRKRHSERHSFIMKKINEVVLILNLLISFLYRLHTLWCVYLCFSRYI